MKNTNIIVYLIIIALLAAVSVFVKHYHSKHENLIENLMSDNKRIEYAIADIEEYRMSKIGVDIFNDISFSDKNNTSLNQAKIIDQYGKLLLVVSNNNCFDCILHLKKILGQLGTINLPVASINTDIESSIDQAKLFGRKDNSIIGLYQGNQDLEINGEYPMIVSLNNSGRIVDIFVSSRYYKDDLNLLRLRQFIAKYGN